MFRTSRRSLRGRLGAAYAVALVAALVAFAVVALCVVDREQRAALDAQLRSRDEALSVVGDVKRGRFSVDAKDRRQFFAILGGRGQSAIVTANGSVAVSTDDATARALYATTGAVAAPAFADVARGSERFRVFARPLVEDGVRAGTALAWSDAGAIGAVDRAIALAFGCAIPLVAAIAILAGDAIVRRGLEPLARVSEVAAAIEAHGLSRRLGEISPDDELRRLTATFDRMLDRLESAFERERRFTSDASHELRAPLSVIRAEADLALREERDLAEYRRALETIALEADALETLTRDLLAAARAGGDRSPPERVDLGDLATSVAERFSTVAGTRRIAVARETGKAAVAAANHALLERAVIGAVHNALKYAPENGVVTIDVRTDGASVALAVGDDGPGFTAVALERAFDRFWRDDEARGSEGSGLGLSIARTIVEGFGGTIAVRNAQPHGATVLMRFPAAPEASTARLPAEAPVR